MSLTPDPSQIPDVMWHGSPVPLDRLQGKDGRKIFLAPNKGLASLFTLDRRTIKEQLGAQSVNFGYDEWALPPEQLQEVLGAANVRHGIEGAPELAGTSSGYIYPVDVSKIKDRLQYFNKPTRTIRELVFSGEDLPLGDGIPVSVPYTVKYSPGKKALPALFDESTGQWRMLDANGYVRLYPEQPTPRTYTKFVYEHRKKMEQQLGRSLNPGEIIHHMDENRSNNDLTNLKLVLDHLQHIREEHPNWRMGKTAGVFKELLIAAEDRALQKLASLA